MPVAMWAIDAIGYEAKRAGSSDTDNRREQDPTQLLADLIRVTNRTGHIGLIGVYFPQDSGGSGEEKKGNFTLALGDAWNKGVSIEMGQAPVKRYNVYLRELIFAGIAKPGVIVSHRPLEGASNAYEHFGSRADGYAKLLLTLQHVASRN